MTLLRWEIFLAFWKAIGTQPIRVQVTYVLEEGVFNVLLLRKGTGDIIFYRKVKLNPEEMNLWVSRQFILEDIAVYEVIMIRESIQ